MPSTRAISSPPQYEHGGGLDIDGSKISEAATVALPELAGQGEEVAAISTAMNGLEYEMVEKEGGVEGGVAEVAKLEVEHEPMIAGDQNVLRA